MIRMIGPRWKRRITRSRYFRLPRGPPTTGRALSAIRCPSFLLNLLVIFLLKLIEICAEALGIDKGIGRLIQPADFLFHLKKGRVGGEKDIARQGFERLE